MVAKRKVDEQNRRGRRNWLPWTLGISIVVLGAVLLGSYFSQRSSPPGEAFANLGNAHIAEGNTRADYNSNPPTSGPHWETVAAWKRYDFVVPDQVLLHNLEDGVFHADTETLTACQRQVGRLERLVADLSLLSRVETGQEQFIKKPVPVCELLEQALQTFRPQFESRKVTLMVEPVPTSWCVLTDIDRTAQVLSNLIGNALRHTPPNGTVKLTAREHGRTEIVFEVRDTGTGVAAEDLPHLFTRFYRGDKARQYDRGGGSGIGLTIAKHYVEAQGGQLRVEVEAGWGSVFAFSLPRSS